MEELILVKPSMEYAKTIKAYIKEFKKAKNERASGGSGLEKYRSPREWINSCSQYEKKETLPKGDYVTADQYILIRPADKKMLGAINFRHSLNKYLAEFGGHIGYSVCPSERRKGYAKEMLRMCLDKCREKGLKEILITCVKENEASRRTMLSAGAVYERTTHLESENKDFERYWITL